MTVELSEQEAADYGENGLDRGSMINVGGAPYRVASHEVREVYGELIHVLEVEPYE